MTEGEWGDGPALIGGHLDAICCPDCHVPLVDGQCPECNYHVVGTGLD